MHKFTREIIEKRRCTLERDIANGTYQPLNLNDEDFGAKQQMCLLDILLQTSIDGKPLSDEDICEEVDNFIFAGDDTTTSGTSHTLYHISRHPEVQKKLFAEIVQVFGKDPTVAATYAQLNNCRYLNNVIKESLRLTPPIAAIGRKTLEDIDLSNNLNIFVMFQL